MAGTAGQLLFSVILSYSIDLSIYSRVFVDRFLPQTAAAAIRSCLA